MSLLPLIVFGLVTTLTSGFAVNNNNNNNNNNEPSNAVNQLNNRPTIAVLAQLESTDIHFSYIAASYVKYIESAGGRAVLIPTSFNQSTVAELFQYVNGVLFPGGSVRWFTSGYYKHAKTFYDLAIQANKNGDYFPIWGTCLGFETLNVLVSDEDDILSKFQADDISIKLNYTDEAPHSRLFADIPQELYKALASESITYNHHSYGVAPATYASKTSLNSFFKILSTNFGLAGKEFISMIEGRDYPFYGAQWHPEKNNFEYNTDEQIPHTITAVKASQYMANFFVNEARKNLHKFPSVEIASQYLSYNYDTEFSGKQGSHFEEIYAFRAKKKLI